MLFKSSRAHRDLHSFPTRRSSDLKRSAVGFLLMSLIMFQTFISRHNSNFFSDKLVLTSVTPAYQKKSLNRKSGSAGMPRPISYAVFCLKKKKKTKTTHIC